MKTPEQFLREVIKYFPDDYVIDTPDEGISIHSIIKAMEEYAIQSVELDVNYKVAIADRNDFRGLYNETVQERNELMEALKTCIDELMYESILEHMGFKKRNFNSSPLVEYWEITKNEIVVVVNLFTESSRWETFIVLRGDHTMNETTLSRRVKNIKGVLDLKFFISYL